MVAEYFRLIASDRRDAGQVAGQAGARDVLNISFKSSFLCRLTRVAVQDTPRPLLSTPVKSMFNAKAGRGQPPKVRWHQYDSIVKKFEDPWRAALLEKRSAKTRVLDQAIVYVAAKYGIFDPWRRLEYDMPEPTDLSVISGGTGDLREEEIADKKDKLRDVSISVRIISFTTNVTTVAY